MRRFNARSSSHLNSMGSNLVICVLLTALVGTEVFRAVSSLA